ncbi:AMIN-like domain-containing (lipo)protein [Rhodococcus erythropolis]|uniref:AMIN-like domain-containing (lipo)protein n=1 Tax=Rhodococcus erythropolis TaxID=1833 RepID=UPI001BECA88D|nr:hypothetical protein [Rhodococcus erythropolis]MBT2263381.1 hypothetical protein [Rhodococcus erythropolis]
MKLGKYIGCFVAVLALTSCGEPSVSPNSSASSTASDSLGCCAGVPQAGALIAGEPIPAPPTNGPDDTPLLTLTSIDLNQSEVGEEVVYRFEGTGRIAWSLRPVAEAIAYGGRGAQSVSGNAIIQVDLADVKVSGPVDGDLERHVANAVGNVVEVIEMPQFDRVSQSFIGLRTSGTRVDVSERTTSDGAQLIVALVDETH